MSLIDQISNAFSAQLEKSLAGLQIIPVDVTAHHGDILTLRNGRPVCLTYCFASQDGVPADHNHLLCTRLKGTNYSWSDVTLPFVERLVEHVVAASAGRPILSALVPMPFERLDVDARLVSTPSLFSFRTLLQPDFNELDYVLRFDAVFGVA